MVVQRIVSHQLESVTECVCDLDGCKTCALRTTMVLPETEVLDCDGVASTVEALPVAIQGVTLVKMCGNDYEKALRCDVNTGNTILIITEINTETGVPTTNYYDMVSGAPYTGNPATDLEVCADSDLESDVLEMCDGTTNFLRWIVKENGEPTGTSYDTTLTGATYTASGAEIIGACVIPETTENLDIITDCAGTTDTKTVTGQLQQVVIHPDQAVKVVVDESCAVDRDVNMLNSCDGTTEVKTVKDSLPTEVVISENQVVKVAIDKTCDVAPTSRNVDINIDCAGTTETVAVKDEFATEVVLKPNQNIEVTIDKSCDTTRNVDMLNSCDGTTEVIAVKDEAATEVIFNDAQVLKVAIDKSCDVPVVDRNIDVLQDCAGTTIATAVSGNVAQEVILGGTTSVINVRLVEDCEPEVDVDYEYICNKTTGFYDLHTFTTTDGVASAPVITATTITCDIPQLDFETQSYCNAVTGTTWIRSVSFNQAGVETVLSDVDTTIACIPAQTGRNVNVKTDCAGNDAVVAVDSGLAQEVILSGSTVPIEVRIKEDCTAPLIKSVTKTIDCVGTTSDIDTTQTVEAVIDQVVDVKQCNKLETVSEIEVCAANVTLVKKTTIDSEGTETIVFYGDNGNVVATPATYTIGSCAVPLTQDVLTQDDCAGATSLTTVNSTVAIAGSMKTLNVRIVEDCVPNFDTEIVSGCSSVDGRIILRKIVKNEETGAETITLVEQDGVTVVTDGSSLVACSGSDYETTEVCKKDALDNYYKLVTFVNSSDTTDTFQIWLDVDGNVVPPVVGATDCEFSCESNMEFERCFDTGAGIVTAQGYYTLSATNIETYTIAKVIGSTDPAFAVGDNVLAQISTWNQVTCQAPTVIVDRATTHARTTGNNTYSAPFRSFSITAVSTDVTLNGQLMMEGFTVSLDSQENEQHITDQVVTGTDYFITYVI